MIPKIPPGWQLYSGAMNWQFIAGAMFWCPPLGDWRQVPPVLDQTPGACAIPNTLIIVPCPTDSPAP